MEIIFVIFSFKYISVRWLNVSTLIRSVAIQCAFTSVDYVSELQFVTLSPLFLSLLGVLIYLLHQAALKVRSKHMTLEKYKKAQRSVRTAYFNFFLMFTFIVLPGVSVFVANMFPCRNLDPDGATGEPVYYLRYSGRILRNNCISRIYINLIYRTMIERIRRYPVLQAGTHTG